MTGGNGADLGLDIDEAAAEAEGADGDEAGAETEGADGPKGAAGEASAEADATPEGEGDGQATDGEQTGAVAAAIELTEERLEALLFVAERPLGRREIAALARTDIATVDARLGDLEVSLAGRGIRLIASGDRVELTTAPEAGALIARYLGTEAVPRLSQAALETLAIVAYGQPITKAGIERIRGVDSDYTVRALLHRRLVVELGRSEAPGRPFLYGTGFDFLERFGLTTLDELPPLEVDAASRVDEGRRADGEGA